MDESDIHNSIKSTTYVLYTLYLKLAKLEIEKEKLRANATQNDIMPDRLNGSDNNED